ncbi:DICT sensory domain-containing protein [Natrinema gelatinilyticum]|uniref:DICT sensory domain-containing protein n=1 Tax=Natrinema gelatinilyticum TaxID=2961571 RepID=UPI0020C45845|nr:DICT sensory domain-containing protein [Natrinema gelatinilyticum]
MNSLGTFIETIDRQRKTLEVHTDIDAVVSELRRQFETRNVDLVHRSLGSLDETGFVIVRDPDGEFRGALGIDQFQAVLSPRTHPSWELAETNQDRSALFDFLDNTLFASYSRRQMLATAREIEERAWRIGSGNLYSGFQRASAFAAQTEVYDRLGSHGSLAVTVFLDDAWDASVPEGVTVVSEPDSELGKYWLVVFDGGDNELESCALIAEERRPGEFYGFWTYDPPTVRELITYLETTYDIA